MFIGSPCTFFLVNGPFEAFKDVLRQKCININFMRNQKIWGVCFFANFDLDAFLIKYPFCLMGHPVYLWLIRNREQFKGRHRQFHKIRLFVDRMLTRNNPKRFWIWMPLTEIIGANSALTGSGTPLEPKIGTYLQLTPPYIVGIDWFFFFSVLPQ